MKNRKRLGAFATLCLLSISLMGCPAAESGERPVQPSPSPSASPTVTPKKPPMKVNPRLVSANTRFSFKLFNQILQEKSSQNVFVSPFSVTTALGMLYNGASGDTKQEMAAALQLQGMTLEEINQANASLKTALEQSDPKVKLSIANSLWTRQGVSFIAEFLQRNKTFYNAQITDLNFDDPGATGIINNWVKETTNGKIEQIVDNIDPLDVMFLINAIYFKGEWQEQFKPELTAPAPFYRADGTQKQHPLMAQTGEYRYLETEQFQAINLPYGDGRVSMYVFLPKPKSSLTDFFKTLSPENWEQWMTRFATRNGSIKLPKFRLESEYQLERTLQALGMKAVFSRSQADLSGISAEKLYVDQVKHKTFVEVNEEGTEAAAVTSVGIRATSLPPPPFQMTVDRPFFTVIRDNQTGIVLFMGAIVDPEFESR